MHPKVRFRRREPILQCALVTRVRGNPLLDPLRASPSAFNHKFTPPSLSKKNNFSLPSPRLIFIRLTTNHIPSQGSLLLLDSPRREPVTVVEERLDSIPSAAFFRPRYEVGWIPDGRLFCLRRVERDTFFIFYRVRSSGTHIISVRSDMYSVDLG